MASNERKTKPQQRSARRARTNDPNTDKVWPEQVIGAKFVRLLEKQLRDLQADDSAEHGNRKLFLDDVFIVHLLSYFNPTIRSLRTIEDFSKTKQAQKHLSVRQICKSTLSEFNQLVDPERLAPIIQALRSQLSRKQPQPSTKAFDLNELLQRTVAVDGTFLHAVSDVAWAVANSNQTGTTRHRARVDAQINVSTWLPEAIVVPEPGESESDSAIKRILADRLYLYDRGYSSFELIGAHYEPLSDKLETLKAKSQFVIRYKEEGSNSPSLTGAVDRKLTKEDRAAGVTSDRVGYFASDSARGAGISQILLREVIVPYEEKGELKTLRLITNLLDVSAATIVFLYQQRWQVELFFRWFKSIGNFGHLISHCREGMLTHLYVTIIATLLMYLHTGYRPSKYMFSMLGLVASGSATLEEILPILRERERRQALDRASAARRLAKKKAASK